MTSTLTLPETLRLALRHFDPEGIRQEFTHPDAPILALMPPPSFLNLAPPIPERIDSAGRSERIEACLSTGQRLADLPELTLSEHEDEPGTWSTEGHDGRHRALAMTGRVPLLPVILRVDEDSPTQTLTQQTLRQIWSQYTDEDDFDDPRDCEQRLYTPGGLGVILLPAADVLTLLST